MHDAELSKAHKHHTQSNKKLVEGLLERHQSAIRHLINRRSGPKVRRLTTVHDLHQETAAVAVASAPGYVYMGDAGFIVWVGTIARRVIARVLEEGEPRLGQGRIRGAYSSGSGIHEAELPGTTRSPSSAAAAGERNQALDRALDRLPEHYRHVIIQFKLKGRPMAGIAAEMGRTRKAVCHLLEHAMLALRKEFREW